MNGYIKINDSSSGIQNLYFGVNNKAKRIKSAYIGVGGKAKRWYYSPTFKDLFNSLDSFDRWGQNGSPSSGTGITVYPGNTQNTYPEPPSTMIQPANGQTWFIFYAVGESLEISKIVLGSSTMTQTKIRQILFNNSSTAYTTAINTNNNGIYGNSQTNASTYLYFHFSLDPILVEDILKNGDISILKGYQNTTATNSSLGVNINYTNGILLPIFTNILDTSANNNDSDKKNTYWGIIDAKNPTSQIIKGGVNGEWLTNSSLLIESEGLYCPNNLSNSGTIATVRGYTLLYLTN